MSTICELTLVLLVVVAELLVGLVRRTGVLLGGDIDATGDEDGLLGKLREIAGLVTVLLVGLLFGGSRGDFTSPRAEGLPGVAANLAAGGGFGSSGSHFGARGR